MNEAEAIVTGILLDEPIHIDQPLKRKKIRRAKTRKRSKLAVYHSSALKIFPDSPGKESPRQRHFLEWDSEGVTNSDSADGFRGENPPPNERRTPHSVCLRPSSTNYPQMNAPRNSTQFIIDDHENSNLFWNFDASHEHPAGMAVYPGRYFGREDGEQVGSPDDDSFWLTYLERDFECAYETARQEELETMNRSELVAGIRDLEHRRSAIFNELVLIDPHTYLHQLQEQLLKLQETNRRLKMQAAVGSSSDSSGVAGGSSAERKDPENDSLGANLPDSSSNTSLGDVSAKNRPSDDEDVGGAARPLPDSSLDVKTDRSHAKSDLVFSTDENVVDSSEQNSQIPNSYLNAHHFVESEKTS